jgi:hypothetical protein
MNDKLDLGKARSQLGAQSLLVTCRDHHTNSLAGRNENLGVMQGIVDRGILGHLIAPAYVTAVVDHKLAMRYRPSGCPTL